MGGLRTALLQFCLHFAKEISISKLRKMQCASIYPLCNSVSLYIYIYIMIYIEPNGDIREWKEGSLVLSAHFQALQGV